MMRSFEEGVKICFQDDVTIGEVITKLRSEVLHNYKLYSKFSSNEVNIFTELDKFSKHPLKYYSSDGTVITKHRTKKNLFFFAKSELSHLDLQIRKFN